jgi:hypothetical protein
MLDKIWRHSEGIVFWSLALLHLTPVWAYRYIPTQDGPSHLDNAQIVKELAFPSRPPLGEEGKAAGAAGYEAYFEIRAEPIPNWTSHVLLAGMLYWVPALTAEKLLVSLYILGFAGSFRYFLGAFGERCRPISWLGLLFVYNRCFWMGFYNYCLSLIWVWLIVGFCLRRRGVFRWPHATVLLIFFPLAYFTHLAGLVVALTGALAAALLVKPRSLFAAFLICLAAAPSCMLTMDYFEQTGFFAQGAGRRLIKTPTDLLQGKDLERGFGEMGTQLLALDREVFEHHAGAGAVLTIALFILFVAFAAVALVEYCRHPRAKQALKTGEVVQCAASTPCPGWLFPFLLGVVFLACYLLLANSLGVRGGLPHGSYLKPRLALLPPLFWLACLRESANPWIRRALRAAIVALLAVNLFLVIRTFHADNETLERFTAGIDAVGRGQRLATFGIRRVNRLASPLAGARHYYCLGTANLSLYNYEAGTPHFPIKHKGTPPDQMTDADILIYWQAAPGAGDPIGDVIFSNADLLIYRRRHGP